MAGPSATDQQLAERIDGLSRAVTDFRLEVAGRFGRVEKELGSIEKELGIIRNLGRWLLAGVFGAVVTLIGGAWTVGWSASAMVSRADQQGARLDRLEGRMDRIDAKLDTLIGRATPKPAGEK